MANKELSLRWCVHQIRWEEDAEIAVGAASVVVNSEPPDGLDEVERLWRPSREPPA
jgi:hypothetical protein